MQKLDTHPLAQVLTRHLTTLPLQLTDVQQQQLVDYVVLLNKWNKAYNLTSVRDPMEMMVKHILDSIVVAPLLNKDSYIDVGTGPGLPGIPLAICHPQKQFTLLDSLGKRIRFITQVKHELGLNNVTPVQSRVEDFSAAPGFDGVLSRAFASVKDMLHWCEHLVDSQGAFLALKGQVPSDELAQLDARFVVKHIHVLEVPALDGQRHLVEIIKAQ